MPDQAKRTPEWGNLSEKICVIPFPDQDNDLDKADEVAEATGEGGKHAKATAETQEAKHPGEANLHPGENSHERNHEKSHRKSHEHSHGCVHESKDSEGGDNGKTDCTRRSQSSAYAPFFGALLVVKITTRMRIFTASRNFYSAPENIDFNIFWNVKNRHKTSQNHH